MAISGGDGSIVLTTKIDETGIEKGMSKLKSGIGAVGKAFALVGTAAAGFVAISKSAVDSYAEFEQLSGGVQKIFNEIDYSKIAEDAGNAYKTMGMSANEYLGVMTTVGANFASTLGDAKGYEVAKQGMQAISDFASGTGRSVDELSEKYQMITKSTSSYQSIADQFAGILPATSAGFLEQAQAAGFLSDSYTKLTDVPMAEYQEAVTQMLSKGVDALSLTGNTAMEASTTLSGATAMMKASWQNLLTGMADPTQNFEQLLQNFISSVGTFLGNLLPVFTTATQGVLQMVQGLLPQIPVLIEQMLPIVIEGVSGIIAGLVEVLPQIVNAVMEILPQLVTAILNMLPQILEAGIQILLSLIQGLTQALPQLIAMLPEIINTIITVLIENLPLIIEAGIQLLIAIVTGLSEAIPQLIDYIPTIIDTLITTLLENLPLIIDCAIQLLLAIIEGLMVSLPELAQAVPEIIITIVKTLSANLPMIIENGVKIMTSLWEGIFSMIGMLIGNIWNFAKSIPEKITEGVSTIVEVGKNIVEGLWNGIENAKDWLLDKIKSFAHTITDGIKSFFGIHSPSTVFRDEIGKNLMLGLANGITGNEGVVSMAMSRVANGLSNTSFAMPNIVSGNILPYFTNAISSSGISATENGVDSSTNGNIPINVQIMLDRRELGSAVVEVSQEEIRRTGGSLVKGARLVIA